MGKRTITAKVYLKGGQVLVLKHLLKLEMVPNETIAWQLHPKSPNNIMSLRPAEIVAVTFTVDWFFSKWGWWLS